MSIRRCIEQLADGMEQFCNNNNNNNNNNKNNYISTFLLLVTDAKGQINCITPSMEVTPQQSHLARGRFYKSHVEPW
eukprot:1610848-Amphidinium_carterae.1